MPFPFMQSMHPIYTIPTRVPQRIKQLINWKIPDQTALRFPIRTTLLLISRYLAISLGSLWNALTVLIFEKISSDTCESFAFSSRYYLLSFEVLPLSAPLKRVSTVRPATNQPTSLGLMKRRIMSVRREYAIDLTITLKLLESTSLIKLISSLYLLTIYSTISFLFTYRYRRLC